MSHELFGERFFGYQRMPAWHRLGITIEREMGAVDALSVIGSYDVELQSLHTGAGIDLPNRAIVRLPTPDDPQSRVFGIVGPEYILMSPLDVCQAWDNSVKSHVETIGSLYTGATLFITTKLPEINVKNESLDNYLLLISPMGGNESAQIRVTPVRPICDNTLIAARRATVELYRVIHDEFAFERLQTWLKGVYERAHKRARLLSEFFNLFASVHLKVQPAKLSIERVYPYVPPPKEDAPEDVMLRRYRYAEENNASIDRYREAVFDLWDGSGTGMDSPATDHTAWGLYNAVCEWEDYHGLRDAHLESQSAAALFGNRAQAKERMFNDLVEVCRK